jgi:hypothetical protein
LQVLFRQPQKLFNFNTYIQLPAKMYVLKLNNFCGCQQHKNVTIKKAKAKTLKDKPFDLYELAGKKSKADYYWGVQATKSGFPAIVLGLHPVF